MDLDKQNFLKLQEEISETEDQIAASRRIYNENVTYFNNKLESFPNNLFLGFLGFKKESFFEIEEIQRQQKVEVEI